MMRVLHISPAMHRGGAERTVLYLLQGLPAKQHLALLYHQPQIEFAPELEALQVPITYLDKKPGTLARIRTAWRYGQLVYRFRPDIIHAHQWHAIDVSRAMKRFFPYIPLVATPNNAISTEHRWRMEERLLWKADHIVCVSGQTWEQYQTLFATPKGRGRTSHIPNAVDLEVFQPGDRSAARHQLELPTEARIGLYMGRIHPQKNIHVLVEAVRRLVERGLWRENDHIVLVGRVDHAEYHARLAYKSVPITLRPPTETPLRFYQAADFLILPSAYEGFSLTLLEAAACGLPAVVSEAANPVINSTQPLLQPGQEGWVVPTGDREALCNALQLAFTDTQLQEKGDSLRLKVQGCCSVHHMVERHMKLYQGLLNPSPNI